MAALAIFFDKLGLNLSPSPSLFSLFCFAIVLGAACGFFSDSLCSERILF